MLKSVFNFTLLAIVLVLSSVIAYKASHFIGGGHGTILGMNDIIPLFIVFFMFSVMALGYIAAGMIQE